MHMNTETEDHIYVIPIILEFLKKNKKNNPLDIDLETIYVIYAGGCRLPLGQ